MAVKRVVACALTAACALTLFGCGGVSGDVDTVVEQSQEKAGGQTAHIEVTGTLAEGSEPRQTASGEYVVEISSQDSNRSVYAMFDELTDEDREKLSGDEVTISGTLDPDSVSADTIRLESCTLK